MREKTLDIMFLGEQKLFRLVECPYLCCISVMGGNNGEANRCFLSRTKFNARGSIILDFVDLTFSLE